MRHGRQLTLHIGFHKTATTYLQDVVFRGHPELIHLGRRWVDDRWRAFFTEFCFVEPGRFDASYWHERFSMELERYLDAHPALATRRTISVSHESLHAGPDWFGVQWHRCAEMLHTAFPDAHIVIGIRSQPGYLRSAYKSYVILGGTHSFERFLELDECRQGLLRKLMYDEVLERYTALFGSERVYVYLLEDLRADRNAFLRDLTTFMGVAGSGSVAGVVVNRALSDRATEVIRRLNGAVASRSFAHRYRNWLHQEIGLAERLRWRLVHGLKRVERRMAVPASRLLSPPLESQIADFYRRSNERLSAMLRRDLRAVGYPC